VSKPPRLFLEDALGPGATIALKPEHAHYLLTVLRRDTGDAVLLFNGRDGEWRGALRRTGKRAAEIDIAEKTRDQAAPPDVHYCFAPIKRARLDFIAQKATEMGASVLQPVLTRFTNAERVKTERLAANAIEAAEQCGVLWVPQVRAPIAFQAFLDAHDTERDLIFCDESAPVANPIAALNALEPGPLTVLIGPEGGFSAEERDLLLRLPKTVAISLGPRIMRADTAGIAAMALVQAVLGDWG